MKPTFDVRLDTRGLQERIRRAPGRAGRAVRAVALEGERIAKTSMGTSPSAPGDPPGVDTGALRASIHTEPRGELAQAIVAGKEYAVYLEFGTTRMAARPFMAPMAQQLGLEAPRLFEHFLE